MRGPDSFSADAFGVHHCFMVYFQDVEGHGVFPSVGVHASSHFAQGQETMSLKKTFPPIPCLPGTRGQARQCAGGLVFATLAKERGGYFLVPCRNMISSLEKPSYLKISLYY